MFLFYSSFQNATVNGENLADSDFALLWLDCWDLDRWDFGSGPGHGKNSARVSDTLHEAEGQSIRGIQAV